MKDSGFSQYIKFVMVIFFTIMLFLNTKAQTINTFPYAESFETGFGAWQQVTEFPAGFDWTRTNTATPTANTGPDAAQDGDWFIYIEADGYYNPPKEAHITASANFTGISYPILSFKYHRFGFDAGYLRFDISTDNGATWTNDVWNVLDINENEWNDVKICLPQLGNKSTVKLRFRAQTQYQATSDIAIDNIEIRNFEITDITHVNPTCNSYTDGSIHIELNGGWGPYFYSVDNGFSFDEDINTFYDTLNLNAADYQVVVKDSSGCAVNGGTIHITEPSGISATLSSVNVSPCYNSTNGSITISASGTYPPFQYSIDSAQTYVFTNYFPNLPKKKYYVYVKNSLGCVQNIGMKEITGPMDITIFDIDTNHVTSCYGDDSGSISVIAGGGTPQLEYSIDGVNFDYGFYFPNLSGGTSYDITIRDYVGCTRNTGPIYISQPDELIINSVDFENILGCFGDNTGYIDISATGGTGNILYSINNESTYSSNSLFENLGIGTYEVYVIDQNECSTYGGTLELTQPEKLQINNIVPVSITGCTGDANGQISIIADGGTGDLLYSIDNGSILQSSNVFSTLGAGTYYPYVEDANGCFDTEPSLTLSEPTAVQISSVSTYNVTDCYNGNNGMISIYASEGTAPYYYSINGGDSFTSEDDFINLYAGDYEIVVKDNYNCIAIGNTYTLTQPTQIVITDSDFSNVNCFGGNDGYIYIDAEGGTGQLVYSVDNGLNYPYSAGDLSYHPAGTYTIKVKDINNCLINGSTLIITEPDELLIIDVDTVDVTGCSGDNSGSLTIYASGGTNPIEYSIDGGNTFQSSNYFPNLEAGLDFIPLIRDFNGCSDYLDPFMLYEPDELYVVSDNHTNIKDCNGSATGTITVVANGGIPPIYYSIDDGGTYSDNGGYFTGLTAGTYTIKIKDSNDCTASGFLETITEPTQMQIDSVITQDVICHSQNNGKLYIYASGGQFPLRYSINGGIDTLFSYQFIGLYPGTYDIEIYDYFKCTLDTSVTITEPDTLILSEVLYTNITTCYGQNEGTITILGEGGMPEILYAYCNLPNPITEFTTTSYYTNLPAGSYYVAIKDQNNCMKTSDIFNLTSPSPISLTSWTKSDITCFGDNNGEIHLTAQGGTGIYEFTIDNGATWQSSDGNYLNLPAGTYVCGAKDSNGCFTTSNFRTLTIFEPALLEFDEVAVYDITCFNANNGGIAIYGTGGTLPHHFALNGGEYQLDRTFDNLAPGEYIPYIQDDNGCTIIGDVVTFINPDKNSYFEASQDTGCSPLSVKFTPEFLQGAFQWVFGDGETSINISPTHVYYNTGSLTENFNVQGICYYQGCKDTSEMTITVRPLPYLNFIVDEEIKYYPDTIFNITNLSQSGFTGYYWEFGDGQTFNSPNPEFHSYHECGDYTIKMAASNEYCSDTVSSQISLTAVAPGANFTIDNNKGCVPVTINFENQTIDAVSYLWDFNNGDISDTQDTSYTFEFDGDFIVSLTAYGYCNTSSTFSKEINIYENPIANFDPEPDTVVIEQAVRFFDFTTGADIYFWEFGDGDVSVESSPIHLYKEPGVYTVKLIASSENGCTDTLEMKNAVTVADEPFVIFPTAFSPNGDSHNDYFIPIYGQIINAELMIFDKWGKMVFKAENLSDYWDGKSLNGEYCQQGVYVWKVKGKYLSGSIFEDVGSVTLLR